MRRMEVEPGEEAQIDFGSGAQIIGADGRRRKTHVFRIPKVTTNTTPTPEG
jgi:hypothetical protein